jgi:hypothetical protein
MTRRGLPRAEVITYERLLEDPEELSGIARRDWVIRLESPGQNFEVEKRLIAAGADVPDSECPNAAFIEPHAALRLPFDKGQIYYPRQWYRGFRALLERIQNSLGPRPAIRWMSTPKEVIRMFDKPSCQRAFARAGLPVPSQVGTVSCFEDLMQRLQPLSRKRVFVKLAHGSSGSGAVALAVHEHRIRAHSSVELVSEAAGWKFYNSRHIRVYEDHRRVAALVDFLCREGVQVEEWLPKETLDGRSFDLRVVVIAGRIRHQVVRVSQSPITNLHLLNARGDLTAAQLKIGDKRWNAAMETCRQAFALFPNSGYAGIDLLFEARSRRHALLEINPFGDLLPGILCDGKDTYEAELEAFDLGSAAW